ncbi:transglycosylase domain-containing protein [Holzapfeliella floricola]|uniref:Penicillin-binding protein 1A n=2 Tax=Holzapfeliella TaxID=2767883 RepID=A0A0R2DS71_9LACO|nr:PBP1A family penicillin-binding protein [Holzapfeliella floricola]KRN03735.1 penicillin-binding protein 1A [Holzapfeliella floricola DSM 23037 = JCM 16512]
MTNNKELKRKRAPQQTPKKAKKKSRLWVRITKWFLMIVTFFLVCGIGLFAFYAKDAPAITQDKLQSGGSTQIYDKNGTFVRSIGTQERDYVTNENIPQIMKDAIVSIEDRRFYQQSLGIDPIRIITSALGNIKSGSAASGGSTITQQLVKLTSFSTSSDQRTLRRKAQEAWLAMQVEREYSKDQILEFYLNKVYMNYGNYGVGTGAKYYYGKELKQLSLPQIALMAAMPNAPTNYDPYVYPDNALKRRNLVLSEMLENQKITQDQYQQAINTPITDGLVDQNSHKTQDSNNAITDAYIKEALTEAQKLNYNPYQDNLKITLNMDYDAQKRLYNLANNGAVSFSNSGSSKGLLQVGATVVDPNTGGIVAMIGGRNQDNVQFGYNRAVQQTRSTGSTIKPLLDYAPAIEYLNWSTSKYLDDSKYIYPGTNVQLYDWDMQYMGLISMKTALVQSRNVPAVKTLQEVGISKASDFVKAMGIDIDKNSGLSVGIGADISSLQLAAGYATFANGGTYYQPTYIQKVESADGNVETYNSTGVRVMKESTAYMITDMLKGVIQPGQFGSSAYISGLSQAGKTGTVQYSPEELAKYPNYASTPKDSWFSGYSKNYVMSIWTGYDNIGDGTIRGTESNSAQLLYRNMMQYLSQDVSNSDWKQPSSVERVGTGLHVKGYAPQVTETPSVSSSSTRQSSSQSSSFESSESSRNDRSSSSSSHATNDDNQNTDVTSPQSREEEKPDNNNRNDNQNNTGE